jgi:cell division septum initiation protein DivIVA
MQHELKQAQSESKQLLREADALKRKLKEDVGAGEELKKDRISFSNNSELKKERETAFDQTLRNARQTVFDETREACRRDMARLLRELELKLGQALESVKYAKETSAHTIRLSEKSSYLHQSLARTISSTAGSDFYAVGGGAGGGGGDNVFSAALHREAMINTKQCKESAERLNSELTSIHQQLCDVLTSVSSDVSGTPRRTPRANTPRAQDREQGSGTLEVPRSEKYSQW